MEKLASILQEIIRTYYTMDTKEEGINKIKNELVKEIEPNQTLNKKIIEKIESLNIYNIDDSNNIIENLKGVLFTLIYIDD